MKKITEMSHEEIIALTDQQKDQMIKLECAERGIPLFDPPEKPKLFPIPDPTVAVYGLEGISYYFKSPAVAREIAEILTENASEIVSLDYDYGVSNEYKYFKEDTYYKNRCTSITTHKVFTHDSYKSLKDKLLGNKKLVDEHKKAMTTYEESAKNIQAVVDEFYEIYNECWEAENHARRMLKVFEDYFQLADREYQTAFKFFIKAYPNASEMAIDRIKDQYGVNTAKFHPCIEKMLEDGPIVGTRHASLLRLASYFAGENIPKDETMHMLDTWAVALGNDFYKIIDQVYSAGYIYSCMDELLSANCENYPCQNVAEEIKAKTIAEANEVLEQAGL